MRTGRRADDAAGLRSWWPWRGEVNNQGVTVVHMRRGKAALLQEFLLDSSPAFFGVGKSKPTLITAPQVQARPSLACPSVQEKNPPIEILRKEDSGTRVPAM